MNKCAPAILYALYFLMACSLFPACTNGSHEDTDTTASQETIIQPADTAHPQPDERFRLADRLTLFTMALESPNKYSFVKPKGDSGVFICRYWYPLELLQRSYDSILASINRKAAFFDNFVLSDSSYIVGKLDFVIRDDKEKSFNKEHIISFISHGNALKNTLDDKLKFFGEAMIYPGRMDPDASRGNITFTKETHWPSSMFLVPFFTSWNKNLARLAYVYIMQPDTSIHSLTFLYRNTDEKGTVKDVPLTYDRYDTLFSRKSLRTLLTDQGPLNEYNAHQ